MVSIQEIKKSATDQQKQKNRVFPQRKLQGTPVSHHCQKFPQQWWQRQQRQ
jgi:hypothetical protein